jgi:hypothetical protein
MAGCHPHITTEQAALIRASRVFFVASVAPDFSHGPDDAGPVNLSPKGGTLHIVDPHRVAYLDRKGSGHETMRHGMAGGPITVMVMSTDGDDAAIVRLFGRASVRAIDDSPLKDLFLAETDEIALPLREVVEIAVDRTHTSCGYGVPVFEFVSHRTRSQRGRQYKRVLPRLFG